MLKNLSQLKGMKIISKQKQTTISGGLKRCRGNTNNSTGCCYNGAWIPAGHRWYNRFCLA